MLQAYCLLSSHLQIQCVTKDNFLAICIFFCYNDCKNDKNVSIYTKTKTPDGLDRGFSIPIF